MSSLISHLTKRQFINPPRQVRGGTHYEVMMGSIAYGCNDDYSDIDIYGFCVPNQEDVFPHLRGEIPDFGTHLQRFNQWQEHHIEDKEKSRMYDVTIYSIVKYFDLCMDCNPNMIDSLFVPNRCILHITKIGQMVRENRQLFLNKKAWHTFKGYAFSQSKKMINKEPEGKRRAIVDKFGFDVKFAYHVIRLLCEMEQIMATGDLDLERDREHYKAIRRGDWSKEQVLDYFNKKERDLEELYLKSSLRHNPAEDAIKSLLLSCLEEHWGSLTKVGISIDKTSNILADLQKVIDRYA